MSADTRPYSINPNLVDMTPHPLKQPGRINGGVLPGKKVVWTLGYTTVGLGVLTACNLNKSYPGVEELKKGSNLDTSPSGNNAVPTAEPGSNSHTNTGSTPVFSDSGKPCKSAGPDRNNQIDFAEGESTADGYEAVVCERDANGGIVSIFVKDPYFIGTYYRNQSDKKPYVRAVTPSDLKEGHTQVLIGDGKYMDCSKTITPDSTTSISCGLPGTRMATPPTEVAPPTEVVPPTEKPSPTDAVFSPDATKQTTHEITGTSLGKPVPSSVDISATLSDMQTAVCIGGPAVIAALVFLSRRRFKARVWQKPPAKQGSASDGSPSGSPNDVIGVSNGAHAPDILSWDESLRRIEEARKADEKKAREREEAIREAQKPKQPPPSRHVPSDSEKRKAKEFAARVNRKYGPPKK